MKLAAFAAATAVEILIVDPMLDKAFPKGPEYGANTPKLIGQLASWIVIYWLASKIV